MQLGRRRLRTVLIVAAGVFAAAVGLTVSGTGAWDGAELMSVDQRFQIRGTRESPRDVVVVGIQDDTFDAVGGRFPFRRSVHAAAIRNLSAADAKLIVYDIQFAEPTEPFDESSAAKAAAEADDLALQEALVAAKRVVLGTDGVFANGDPAILFDDGLLREANATVGGAFFEPETGGVFRHVPYETEGLPSLAVAAVTRTAGGAPSRGGFSDRGAWIDYAGPPGTISFVPFQDVFRNTASAQQAVAGKVVVVGNTAQNLGDVDPTPFEGEPMAGPEIHANAIATLLGGVPLRDAPGWLNVLILLALSAIATLLALRRSAWLVSIGAAALVGVYLVMAQVAFNAGTVLDVAAPVLSTALIGLAGLGVNYWFVVRDRARLRGEFARFLPAPIVDDLVDEVGESGRIGGRRVYATVMFADLRGFTAAAERLPPEVVIEVLNRYLTEMSDAVLDHGGTLVAYHGDGLMAVFGAPVESIDHADRALAAAREMRDVRLSRFNAWAAPRGIADGFRMGLGLASGPVMSGNVGSERRVEYTAVGDTTNAAARLETLTKDTPHMLLIADATRAALTKPVPDLQAVGALDIRGRQVPAAVWTLPEMPVGPPDGDPTMVDGDGEAN
jgi:adenylate cyclase